jgi:hypothetical protein
MQSTNGLRVQSADGLPHTSMAVFGAGPDTVAQLLIAAGDNPDRLRSEAHFAALAGACPIPASSGKTNRHRLNRAGDRQANSAAYHVVIVRMRHDPTTRDTTRTQTKCIQRSMPPEDRNNATETTRAPIDPMDRRTPAKQRSRQYPEPAHGG